MGPDRDLSNTPAPASISNDRGEVIASDLANFDDTVDARRVAALLDANHIPETNGWMAVCRKCGIRTASPEGLHAPHALQIAAAEAWLERDTLGSNIARLQVRRNT